MKKITASETAEREHVTRADIWKIPGRERYARLTAGSIFKVRGERGDFRFLAIVHNLENGESWIDAYGGSPAQFRAFRPEILAKKITVKDLAPERAQSSPE